MHPSRLCVRPERMYPDPSTLTRRVGTHQHKWRTRSHRALSLASLPIWTYAAPPMCTHSHTETHTDIRQMVVAASYSWARGRQLLGDERNFRQFRLTTVDPARSMRLDASAARALSLMPSSGDGPSRGQSTPPLSAILRPTCRGVHRRPQEPLALRPAEQVPDGTGRPSAGSVAAAAAH